MKGKNIMRKQIIISMLVGSIIPIAGIVCFFLRFYIGLYICAGYAVLYAINRLTKGDAGVLLGLVISVVLAAILRKPIGIPFLPLASAFICVKDLATHIIDCIYVLKN